LISVGDKMLMNEDVDFWSKTATEQGRLGASSKINTVYQPSISFSVIIFILFTTTSLYFIFPVWNYLSLSIIINLDLPAIYASKLIVNEPTN